MINPHKQNVGEFCSFCVPIRRCEKDYSLCCCSLLSSVLSYLTVCSLFSSSLLFLFAILLLSVSAVSPHSSIASLHVIYLLMNVLWGRVSYMLLLLPRCSRVCSLVPVACIIECVGWNWVSRPSLQFYYIPLSFLPSAGSCCLVYITHTAPHRSGRKWTLNNAVMSHGSLLSFSFTSKVNNQPRFPSLGFTWLKAQFPPQGWLKLFLSIFNLGIWCQQYVQILKGLG